MFCKHFLAYTLHIDWRNHVIHKHPCMFQVFNIISVLTTCTSMTILGMHRRSFEGRHLVMPLPSVTGEVNCFPRRQLIFSFDRHVIYHSKGLWEYILKSIPFVCLYHDLPTNSETSFLYQMFHLTYQWSCLNELYRLMECVFQISN